MNESFSPNPRSESSPDENEMKVELRARQEEDHALARKMKQGIGKGESPETAQGLQEKWGTPDADGEKVVDFPARSDEEIEDDKAA